MNRAETKALPVGKCPRAACIVGSIAILEITFTEWSSRLSAANWSSRISALRGVLVDARLRAFNLVQRVAYLNTYAHARCGTPPRSCPCLRSSTLQPARPW